MTESIDFQTSHYFEQVKVDIYSANSGQVKIDPIRSFYRLWTVTIILLSLVKTCLEDRFNPLRLIKIQEPRA